MPSELPPLEAYAAFAQELALASEKIITPYFGTTLTVHRKADASPVTAADRNTELKLREMIHAYYPEHQVLGEEEGLSGPPQAQWQWLLDPIDGTEPFIHGIPLFTTLIALLWQGSPIIGLIHQPILKEQMLGVSGKPTLFNGNPAQVSATTSLKEASVLYTSVKTIHACHLEAAFAKIQNHVRTCRGWGDAYGHMLVARGKADAMLDPILKPWDIAALRPCIEGAGGRITQTDGKQTPLGENALSTNGHLHEELLALLA